MVDMGWVVGGRRDSPWDTSPSHQPTYQFAVEWQCDARRPRARSRTPSSPQQAIWKSIGKNLGSGATDEDNKGDGLDTTVFKASFTDHCYDFMHMNDSIPRLILDRAPDGLNEDKVRSNRVRYVRMERSSLSESQSFRLIASRSLAMRLKVSHTRRTQLANRVDTDKYRSYSYSRPSVPESVHSRAQGPAHRRTSPNAMPPHNL